MAEEPLAETLADVSKFGVKFAPAQLSTQAEQGSPRLIKRLTPLAARLVLKRP